MNEKPTLQGAKLALCGGMRSGKDSVALYLGQNYGFVRFAFGDEIRELCREYFPDLMNGPKPRALLQGVGQDLRQYDEDVWVKRLFSSIEFWREEARRGGTGRENFNVAITDLRQPNEFAALRHAGFYIVKVAASRKTRLNRMLSAGEAVRPEYFAHETESHYEAFDVDYVLQNDGTPDELKQQVEEMIYRIQSGGVTVGQR